MFETLYSQKELAMMAEKYALFDAVFTINHSEDYMLSLRRRNHFGIHFIYMSNLIINPTEVLC